MEHTRTGNPLVDSVVEHQAANPSAYWHYLQGASTLALYGAAWLLCWQLWERFAGLPHDAMEDPASFPLLLGKPRIL